MALRVGERDDPIAQFGSCIISYEPEIGVLVIREVIEKWHQHTKGQLPGGLDELLDDDVVFYSPIVYTPQRGKAITTMYLQAAGQTLPGEPKTAANSQLPDDASNDKSFRYTKQTVSGDTAVLEFETTVDGKYVNGVDIITCNQAGKIIEFRVMIRPLQAINLVHRQMGEMLATMNAQNNKPDNPSH